MSAGTLCFYAAVASLAAAAGVWETKPFTEWTDKETQAVMTDSPWAGKGSLTNGRSGGSFSPVPDWKVTVSWRSGLPIRQALVRQQIGQGGKVMADQQDVLAKGEPVYIIAVEGLPGMYAGGIQALAPQTALERDGKAPIMPTQGVAQLFDKDGKQIEKLPEPARGAAPGAAARGGGRGGGFPGEGDGSTATLFFGFPKTDPITAADKEVDFSMNLGSYHLRRKFHLKDMVLNGEPSL